MPVYDKEERHSDRLTLRVPTVLREQAERFCKIEGLRSPSEAAVRGLRLGLAVYQCIEKYGDELSNVRAPGRLTVEEAVTLLLEEALQARAGNVTAQHVTRENRPKPKK